MRTHGENLEEHNPSGLSGATRGACVCERSMTTLSTAVENTGWRIVSMTGSLRSWPDFAKLEPRAELANAFGVISN